MRIQVMKSLIQSIGPNTLGILVLFLLFLGSILLVAASFAGETAVSQENGEQSRSIVESKPASPASTNYPILINRPSGPPRVDTGMEDPHGNSITVACSTCHTTRKPNITNRKASDLDEFHQKMPMSHGNLSCVSCHNPEDYDSLKLADGSRVEFTQVMKLCAQCHGPQTRDYRHGAHGGMNGYWDLSKGPRTRNNCVDCHKPHAPQFPKMRPTFKPRDRFLNPVKSHEK
ncbi:MAG: hypothetical protein COA78_06295 [Blastopirellula sp.]|nr:MAG: hypothetical protein COA78_06295 [Blastopirellula sp.]